MTRKLYLLVCTLCALVCIDVNAQFASAPAFPGAEGYGRYATGGRGGTVYHVTTLEDYCDNTDYSSTKTKDSEIAGSLRYAVKKSGARIIVFDVAGTIELKAPLKIQNDDITILGQTAPGDGICLKNHTVGIFANNVIIRYIRCRLGNDGRRYYSNETALTGTDQIIEDDAMNGYQKDGSNKQNIIIDHCSISWSVDECASFYGNKDFTLQWCMMTESLRNAGHTKGNHGFGGIWGGERASFHHNMLADHDSRNPRFDHGYVSTLAGPVDYTNNVLYNWGGNSAYGGENKSGYETKKFNMINNYYRYGSATSDKDRLLNPTTYCTNCNSSSGTSVVPGTFYISGNYMYGSSEVTNDNTCSSAIKMDSKGKSYTDWKSGYVSSTKFTATTKDFASYNTISLHAAETSYNKVLQYAGASYKRDAVDTRVCNDAKNGTTSYTTSDGKGSNGATGGLIDMPSDVGGYPTLSGTKATDTDNDGIPDEWEDAYGLDKNSAADALTYTIDDKKYYTNLEVYANSLVEKITKAEREGATETFEEYYPLDNYVPNAQGGSESGFHAIASAEETILLTKANIEENDYLSAATNNWSTSKTYGGVSGEFYNMSSTDRSLTIKIADCSKIKINVQNSTNGRTYSYSINGGSFVTITHGGTGAETTSDIEVPSGNVTIVLKGGGSSVYPISITAYKRDVSGGDTEEPDPEPIAVKPAAKKKFDYVVGRDGTINDAIAAANAWSGSGRYLIFVPDGRHRMTGNASFTSKSSYSKDSDHTYYKWDEATGSITSGLFAASTTYSDNAMTWLKKSNVSIIGQSKEGTVIYNIPYIPGISYTSTLEIRSGYSNTYLQDFTLKNMYAGGANDKGVAVAFYDRGTNTIAKNLNAWSNQDTYTSAATRCYYETSTFAGTVDFICGSGDVWFEKCDLVINNRKGNVITAPRTASTELWGYVFNGCTISKADGATNVTNGNWNLGRPWNASPASTFLYTKMNVLPSNAGWTKMTDGCAIRFHEYGSTNSSGTALDLSSRSVSACNGASADAPVLTKEQASKYKVSSVVGVSNDWDPRALTLQVNVSNVTLSGNTLSWNDNDYALCWVVFKDGAYYDDVITNSITLTESGTYTVRAANSMGGLGEETEGKQYYSVEPPYNLFSEDADYTSFTEGTYDVKLKKTLPVGQWTTLVLPFNATTQQLMEAFPNSAANTEVAVLKELRDNTIYFVTQARIDANVPVLIKLDAADKSNDDTYTFKDVTVVNTDNPNTENKNGVMLKGLYKNTAYNAEPLNSEAHHVYFIYQNKFYHWSNLSNIPPFSAYIYTDQEWNAADAKPITFMLDGEPTDISCVNASTKDDGAEHNAIGLRISKTANGLHIKKGKKSFVK